MLGEFGLVRKAFITNQGLLTRIMPSRHHPASVSLASKAGAVGGGNFDSIAEFGIITAARDLDLSGNVYNMDELRNTDGGQYVR